MINLTTAIHRLYYYLQYLITSKSIYSIHSPFVYQFVKECLNKNNHYYFFDEMNRLRQKLLNEESTIDYKHLGVSSFSSPKKTPVSKILKTSVSPAKYSELYFRIALFLKSECVLELGTSLGINTLYLSKSARSVISIEGQKSLCDFAQKLFHDYRINNIQLICSDFDAYLNQMKEGTQWDLVFIDGNHTYEATIRYYYSLKNHLRSVSALILDDIYWDKNMTKAWNEIIQSKDIKATIDLYRCGIVLFNKNFITSQHFVLWY